MRRFAHRLVAFGSLVSLVVCAGACVMWVRSYFASDLVEYHVADPHYRLARQWTLICNRGMIGVGCTRRSFEMREGFDDYLRHDPQGLAHRRLLHCTHAPFAPYGATTLTCSGSNSRRNQAMTRSACPASGEALS